eukprot:2966021-Lingulodinium_polyedra.AAC.1
MGWAWGKKSAPEVVRDAEAVVQDQGARNVDPRILRLAKSAANMQNAQRVLESMLPDRGLPEATLIEDSSVQLVLEPFG